MKRILKGSLKIIGVLLILLIAIFIYFYISATNYTRYDLKPDKELVEMLNGSNDFEDLAKRLVSKMTLEEKIDQMYGEKMLKGGPKMAVNVLIHKTFPRIYVGKNERLHIPPFVLSDGPRGARVIDREVKGVTTFPVAMARGASWDPELEYSINEIIAKEMRANKTNYAATPCINLLRHPAWGRAQETYGEDPFHLGQFGMAAVRGIQKHNVMACPKHFAANSIENSRFLIDVELDKRTLHEVYLPHFKDVIVKAKSASIMSAYNSVNNEYMSDNDYLLSDVLREDWGFEGFVTSDWVMGTKDAIESINAGMDIEMPFQNHFGYKDIKDALANGKIKEETIDRNVTRILKTRLKYAFAKDSQAYPMELLASPEHIAVAKEAAAKSMVLLKNDSVLPFNKGESNKIAVIGRLADKLNTGDFGSSDSRPPYVISPLEGIKAYHAGSTNIVEFNDGTDLKSAHQLASSSDQVVLIVGYTAEDEGEYINMTAGDDLEKSAEAGKLIGDKGTGGDRESLKLLPEDEQLIEKLKDSNPNLVIVYIGGSAIDMSTWDDEVPAILFAWYGGMEGGNALASILYGDINPSGKLPFSIPENVKDYPYFTPYAKKIEYGYYHGYTLFDKMNIPVAYPFGYGLSYTDFRYDNLRMQDSIISQSGTLKVFIDVENIGPLAGEEVIQLYIGFKNSKVDRPVKLLRGFKKVYFDKGRSDVVSFEVSIDDLGWYNPQTNNWEIELMDYELYVGKSSAKKDLLQSKFRVVEENDIECIDVNPI